MPRYILKQAGDLPKCLSHMAKFDDNRDLLFHLRQLKRQWNTSEFGEVDFDLMEIVEGTEVAASAFFNGTDWMRDANGKVVGYLNWEEKKECDGNTGETTGEMGTTFLGVTEDNELFADILLRDGIKERLREADFHGIFDINGMVTEEGDYVAFEATCRFGIPATSYELLDGLTSSLGDFIASVASGRQTPVEIKKDIGMVMVIAAKPYPNESHVEDEASSRGERLWLLDSGELRDNQELTKNDRKRIHLENFRIMEDDGEEYIAVASTNGYLLTVTGSGDSVESVREELIEFIKDNIYLAGMKYRQDIGKRCEDFIEEQYASTH